MSHGIKIYSASGQEMLSTEDFATRFIRVVEIAGSNGGTFPSQGSISIPELANEPRVWHQSMRKHDAPYYLNGYGRYQAAHVTISGTTLSWRYLENYNNSYVYMPMTVVIGAY
jgi:hypothetical protein